MAGSQSFSKRVLIPLAIIALTVSGLCIVGLSLWHMSSAPLAATGPQDPTSATDAATFTPNGYLPVNVFNGSSTAGLARMAAGELEAKNWTVSTIGNWMGEKVGKSTIFYPSGAKDSALALSAQIHVRIEVASSAMSQSELTYVVAR